MAEPTALSRDQVVERARNLRAHAEHFQQRDWDYTRDTGDLVAVRYDNPYDSLGQRVRRALRWLCGRHGVMGPRGIRERLLWAKIGLRRERNMPDGVLNGGNILTFWEEDGEYLQYVQPSVGSLIATWLEAEPESPHAQAVAAEMARIQERYAARIEAANGWGSGSL